MIFILVFAAMIFASEFAFAYSVSPGEAITITVKNSPDSAGDLEGVHFSVSPSPFVYLEGIDSPPPISKGGAFTAILRVRSDAPKKSGGLISFTVTHYMVTSGGCATPGSWSASFWVEVPDDTDNDDPTYIQLPRGGPYSGPAQPRYQFSPGSSPGSGDTLKIEYSAPFSSYVTIQIYDKDGKLVRALAKNQPKSTGPVSNVWDGKNNRGEYVPEGAYTLVITGVNTVNASKTWTVSEKVIVDDALPLAKIDFIKADTPRYNSYSIMGSATDTYLDKYTLTCIDCTPPLEIATSQTGVENGVLGVLNAAALTDGQYTIRLDALDHAGNSSTDTAVLVLDRTTNGLKIHIDSVSQNIKGGFVEYAPSSDDPNVWFDDDFPAGSTPLETWEWDTSMAYSGRQSHTDPLDPNYEGVHGHYFIHAQNTLALGDHDNIIQYVYLDPSYPPEQIMLQFYTGNGDGEHRAFWNTLATWGHDIYTGGQIGTASLYPMGTITETGKWLRLKIPASAVGLNGKEVKGVAFMTRSYSNKAHWDKTTKSSDYNETQKESWAVAPQISSEDRTDTIIDYSTTKDAHIRLSVYDQGGNLVKTLIDEFKTAGSHQILWDSKNSSGIQVPDGKYYFQFSSPDGPVESNTYAVIHGDWSSKTIPPLTSLTDSKGDRYAIDPGNHAVHKYDSSNALLFSISGKSVGTSILDPSALAADLNDNLFIVDKSQNKVFKLNPDGYYLNELPYKPEMPWGDEDISLNQPSAVLLDENGDVFVANQNGTEKLKLAVGRGVIDISNLIASIRVPYKDSLVYAYVPIIGAASGKNFDRYTVEYGFGENPSKWITMTTSHTRVLDDDLPIPDTRTIYGNLATWHVTDDPYDRTGGLPMGTYTIRLTVYDKEGNYKQDKVRVEVARVVGMWVGMWEGTVTSDDGLVSLLFPNGSIADNNDLFLIKPADVSSSPPINDPALTLVGKVYEIKPAGYKFTKPVTLEMRYTHALLGSVNENTLKIYRWNPMIRRWVYVYAALDKGKNVLTTSITELNDYEVYYAIMSDPPPAPVLYPPVSPTILSNIVVYGQASQGVDVEIFVDGMTQGSTQADVNTGSFVKEGIQLKLGDNYLTAVAVDPAGNTSLPSDPVLVQVVLTQPTGVTSVAFKTADFASDFTNDVTMGDYLYVELVGTDGDPTSVDSATVRITSNLTDPSGILVQLLETAADSGIYRGTARVSPISSASLGEIGVSASLVETITVTSEVDPTKQDSLNTRDKIPPPAPLITSPTHPSLSQDTFEVGLGEWANRSGIYGADVSRSSETSFSGAYSVKMVNTNGGGDFANNIRSTPFDARQYRFISFDYKIPKELKVNLVAYVNGMWKEIVFTDDPKRVRTFGDDIYRTIGKIENPVADGNWHHAEFNLYSMLRSDDPSQSEYIVEELFFGDYNLPGWMELVMGGENPQGLAYYIDNFVITEGGKSNNNPTFAWLPNDTSVVGYSYVLDQKPSTVPDQVSEGGSNTIAYANVPDGVWYFHVSSIDGGGNWGPANHYQILVDTVGPIADSPEPGDGSSSGSLVVKIRITDGNGSGVNPDTIKLKLKDRVYDIGSGGLKYDEKTGILAFSLWKVTPKQDPWLDGETIEASLVEANDFAGNPLQSLFSWSWTVDYSKLSGGYLSLLTTKGGYTPTWSSDGTKIAFMSERSGNKDIWVIDADDYAELRGTARQLTSGAGSNHHPSWSPDTRIAFNSDRGGYDQIWVINSDGTGLTQVTNGEFNDSHPTWSPDGSKLAFSRGEEIWMINSDGTNETQITFDSIEWYFDPVWSPDGKRIAFTKSLYVDEVAVMDVDGNNQEVLTKSGYDSLPAWSKKTNQIVFVTKRDEKTSAIRIVDSDGSNEDAYIDNKMTWWDSEPDQSPVNDNIAFQSTRNGAWNIWVKTELQLSDISVSPDPFSPDNDGIKDTVDIKFNISGGAAAVDLRIYDVKGDLIAALLSEEFAKVGENIVKWDGTDEIGNTVADGIYTYKIKVLGSAGAANIEKSGTIRVDTTPPTFGGFVIPDIKADTDGPQNISVSVTDEAGVNMDVTLLQYGIAETEDEKNPSVIQWTDFGTGLSGILDLSWSNFAGKYLYIRGYGEDVVGNATYSEVQKRLISRTNSAPVSPFSPVPMNGATNVPLEVVLAWGGGDPDSSDTVAYDVYFGMISPPVSKVSESQLSTSYVPSLLAYGTTYYWKIVARDNHGAETEGSVWSFTTLSNNAPIADSKNVTTQDNTPVVITLSGSDTETSVINLVFSVVTQPGHGTLSGTPPNLTYTPNPDYIGSDSFTYTVTDRGDPDNCGTPGPACAEAKTSAPATVSIKITPVNDPPAAENKTVTTLEDTPVGITLSGSDTETAAANLTFKVTSPPTHGTLSGTAPTLTYKPDHNYNGPDSFTYTVTDRGDPDNCGTPGPACAEAKISGSATVSITINPLNDTPVADAGHHQNVITGKRVTLNGSESYDPDGAMITLHWRFVEVPSGSSVTDESLSDPYGAKPEFTPDVDGAYRLQLIVNDGVLDSAPDEVVINATTPNVAPNADAGSDQNAYTGHRVDLDGSKSSDPEDGPMALTYLWSFAAKPIGSLLINNNLMGRDQANASFTPDVDGAYTVRLSVDDGALTSYDEVVIVATMPNVPPNANAGDDFTIYLGQTAILDGSKNNDPDNGPEPLSYSWRFVTVPTGSQLKNEGIMNANTAFSSFTPDVPGVCVLELMVFDGKDAGFDNVAITVKVGPVAEAGGPYSGVVGSPITLDASVSYDPDGSIVSYEWDWNNDGFYDEKTLSPTISHTWGTTYSGTVGLKVTDNEGLTGYDTASLEVKAKPVRVSGGAFSILKTQPTEQASRWMYQVHPLLLAG